MDRRILPICSLDTDRKTVREFAPGPYNEQIVLEDYTYTAQRMGTTEITATLRFPVCLDNLWTGREFVSWIDGERFFLLNTPSSEKSNSDARYVHSLVFRSERDIILDSVYFVDCVLPEASSSDRFLSNSTTVRFAGTLAAFVQRINDVLEYRGLADRFSVDIEDGIETEDLFVEFEDKSIFGALRQSYELWGIPFYFNGNVCVFGYGESADNIPRVEFEYGRDNQLISIKKSNDNARIVTRCTGIGSTENIPEYYPNPTAKGTLGVEVGGTLSPGDVVISEQNVFARGLDMGETIRYQDVKVRMYDFVYDITEKTTTNGIKKFATKASFKISREMDGIEETVLANPVVTLTLSTSVKDGNLSADFATNADELFAKYPLMNQTTLRDEKSSGIIADGRVRITNVSTYSDLYDGKASYTNGTETNYGDIQRSFPAREIRITDWDFKYNTWTQGFDSAYKTYRTVRSSDGVPITMYIFLNQGETRTITVSYEIEMDRMHGKTEYLTSGQNKVTDAIVSAWVNPSIRLAGDNDYSLCWRRGTEPVNLDDIGLALRDGVSPSRGDSITQIQVAWDRRISQNLMPPLFRITRGEERFYPAVNSPFSIETMDSGTVVVGPYYDPESGEQIVFNNEYVKEKPREFIQTFEDIKPTIRNVRNALGENIDIIDDVFYETGYDPDMTETDSNGNENRKYSLFFVKLRKTDGELGFNIFNSASVKNEMTLVMRSGACGSCEFRVAAVETSTNKFINPVRVKEDADGNVVPLIDATTGRVVLATTTSDVDESQQDSRNGVWIALYLDESTYGGDSVTYGVMPAKPETLRVKAGDSFSITGIELPQPYILAAEMELENAIIKFMKENNDEKYSWTIAFSRDYLADNPEIRDMLSEHSALNIRYNGESLPTMYVDSYTYKLGSDALPEITVNLGDVIEVNTSGTQNKISKAVSEAINSRGLGDVRTLIEPYYLRKDREDSCAEKVTFDKGFTAGNYVYGRSGASLEIDPASDESTMEVDFLRVRKKAVFSEIDIKRLQQVGGGICVSLASVTITAVARDGDNFKCYFRNTADDGQDIKTNDFVVGDLARCESFSGGTHFWWREVVDVGDDYITLSYEGAPDSDIPYVGDVAVQFGNTTDPTRQSVQVLSCYGDNAPSYRIYKGIDGYSLEDRDIAGIVFDENIGEPKAYVYGETHIGDRNGDQFIRYYTNTEGNRILEINGAALANLLAVKDDSGNIVAGINGSDDYTTTSGEKIMMFAGSSSGSASDVANSKYIVTKNGDLYAKSIIAEQSGRIAGYVIDSNVGLYSIEAGKYESSPFFGRDVTLSTKLATSFQIHKYYLDEGIPSDMIVGYVTINQDRTGSGLSVYRNNAGYGNSDPAVRINSQDGANATALRLYALGTSGNNVAIEAASGMYKGFRPYVRVITGSTTLVESSGDCVVINASTSTTTVTINLPKTPTKGCFYKIVNRFSNGKMVISGNGKNIYAAGLDATSFTVSDAKTVELIFDGVDWQYLNY